MYCNDINQILPRKQKLSIQIFSRNGNQESFLGTWKSQERWESHVNHITRHPITKSNTDIDSTVKVRYSSAHTVKEKEEALIDFNSPKVPVQQWKWLKLQTMLFHPITLCTTSEWEWGRKIQWHQEPETEISRRLRGWGSWSILT